MTSSKQRLITTTNQTPVSHTMCLLHPSPSACPKKMRNESTPNGKPDAKPKTHAVAAHKPRGIYIPFTQYVLQPHTCTSVCSHGYTSRTANPTHTPVCIYRTGTNTAATYALSSVPVSATPCECSLRWTTQQNGTPRASTPDAQQPRSSPMEVSALVGRPRLAAKKKKTRGIQAGRQGAREKSYD